MVDVDWSSSIEAAESYERVLVPALFERWAEPMLSMAEVKPGDLVLDVACGTGVVSRHALDWVGEDGQVVGVDIDAAMLEVAERCQPRVRWEIADATDLPYDDETFDVVVCQAGLMFFSDQAKAIGEMKRVLRTDGRAIFHVWAYCEAQERFARLLELHLGETAANNYRTPWNLQDPTHLLNLVRAGGFTNPRLSTIHGEAVYPSVEMFLRGATGILVPPETNTDQLRQDTTSALHEFIRSDGVLAFPEPAHIVTAADSPRPISAP